MPLPYAIPPPPPVEVLAARLGSESPLREAPPPPREWPTSRSRASRPRSIGSVVSTTYDIRVHWSREGDQDRARETLSWVELAWAVQVDELGFRAPVLPDGAHGPQLDVYLSRLGSGQAWAYAPEWVDATPGDGFMGTPAYIEIDRNLPLEWLPSYSVHEFNHVLQYATDFTEATLTIWEATAVSAQLWTLGEDGHWDGDVADFQAVPWVPVLVGDGYWLWDELEIWNYYEYGAALWMIHLDEVHGDGDGRMGPRLWEAVASEDWTGEPDVGEGVQTVTGLDLGGALSSIARSRVLVGELWDERGLVDARTWGEEMLVPMVAELHVDELPTTVVPEPAPMVTGQSFLDIALDGRSADLEVRVESEAGLDSALLVLWWGEDGAVGEEVGVDLVRLPIHGLSRAIVALTNLGPPGWDADDHAWDGGDQRIHLTLRDIAEVPPPAVDDDPPGDDPSDEDPPDEDVASCGCGAGASGWWLIPLVPALARRRRAKD